ncbi:MAG: endonuclease III [Bacteroidetes bacterium]|nr:MAG: endonuclease III [Bacteroidota bacterium]PIE87553.1 MAG: endonuclease III [Bacteroidota bacterium]
MKREERFRLILDYFQQHNPDADTELNYKTPYELLVAVVLSAQCTDKRVNLITPAFFERFPDVAALSEASVDEVFSLIKSCSYPNNKAKHLCGMARMLEADFGGVIPGEVAALQRLPGVGRKTANVIASIIFHKPAMAVDTHVFRVSERMGLTYRAKNPLEAEQQLVKYIPEALIPRAHHWLILHGRYVCTALKPKCLECGVAPYCKTFNRRT